MKPSTVPRSCRNIVDGTLLGQFLEIDGGMRRKLARAIGSSDNQIIDIFVGLDVIAEHAV